MLRRAVAFTLLLAPSIVLCLPSCVVAPTSGDPSLLSDARLDRLLKGRTRADVLSELGEPDESRKNGDLWFYWIDVWVVIVAPPGAGGESSWALVVEYEGGNVVTYEVIPVYPQGIQCTEFEVCVTPIPGWSLTNDETIIASRRLDDAAAKAFDVDLKYCAVYLFSQRAASVELGRYRNLHINSDTYIYLKLEPGMYVLSYDKDPPASLHYQLPPEGKLELDCQGGDLHFVEAGMTESIYKKTGTKRTPGKGQGPRERYSLEKILYLPRSVEEELGKEAIFQRSLTLLP
mgnify:CR=1 FL=1